MLKNKIDELLLLGAASKLLDEQGFLIMNTYSPTVDGTLIKELAELYFPEKTVQVSQLHMETKTEKTLYYGELLRVV